MQPVRVLNLFTIMNRGGAETMIMNYYRHLDRSKIQFDFMVHRQQRGEFDDEIERLGGCIYRMCPLKAEYFVKYKKMVSRFFDEHDEYRIIHSNMSESGYIVFKEASKRGIPIRICHAHNAPIGWDIKMFVRTYFKVNIRRYTTDMFACGRTAGIWLYGEKASDKVFLINNAIDVEKYKYCAQINRKIREEFKLSKEIIIGHVGRFSPQKNHIFLMNIFSEIVKLMPEARLMLVGEGEERDKIKRYASHLGVLGKVIFTGVRSDVSDLMQAMDVFLFPSLFEGLSVAMIEAQAAGLPCVISNQIPSECIKTNGLVSAKALTDSPKAWAKDVIKRAKEGHTDHQQELISAGFDIRQNAEWLQNFYLRRIEEESCLR